METISNREPEDSSRSRRRIAAIAGAAVLALLALFFLAHTVAGFVAGGDTWTVVAGEPVEVTIEPGSSASSIYALMHDSGVVRRNDLKTAAKRAGVEDRLQAGTYSLVTDMQAEVVVQRLVEGGDIESDNTFTVIEGWTIARIVDELSDRTAHSRTEFESALTDGSVSSPHLPDGVQDPIMRWEGLLFPAKYLISDGATPAQILQMMADEMTRRFEQIDWSHIGELGISRYDALILASLIEWESGTDEDRPIISSVIHNRLARPMRLQIDATVIYALGTNPGRVLASHLEVESPYNTYRIDGLPPTPIGTVSAASLDAAVHPASTPYLFYVLGDKDGSHVFAVTYDEHQANVKAAKAAGVLP